MSVASAERIRKQVRDALDAGAKELVGAEGFEVEQEGNAFVGPKVLVDVTHEMDVMMEEVGPACARVCVCVTNRVGRRLGRLSVL